MSSHLRADFAKALHQRRVHDEPARSGIGRAVSSPRWVGGRATRVGLIDDGKDELYRGTLRVPHAPYPVSQSAPGPPKTTMRHGTLARTAPVSTAGFR